GRDVHARCAGYVPDRGWHATLPPTAARLATPAARLVRFTGMSGRRHLVGSLMQTVVAMSTAGRCVLVSEIALGKRFLGDIRANRHRSLLLPLTAVVSLWFLLLQTFAHTRDAASRSEGVRMTDRRVRYAIVGTGARAQLFVRALAVDHAERCELVALADPNPARVRAHNDDLAALGAPRAAEYDAADVVAMLAKERVDVLLVTTIDRVHDEYIVAALENGCAVVTEKPMTIDVPRCQRILDAARRTGRSVRVTFNYRYNPLHERVREVLAAGEIGEVSSVHFEWLLDVRHGADYFRRWHRDKANSGGLLVHKASHHFDLINWWLGAEPVRVFAEGRLFFYGENGVRHGYARPYDRAYASLEAADDPFALHLAANPDLRRLYLDAEVHDGYHRDRNVFAPGVTSEDDLSLLVRASTGATMTYHLTAYAPWEGYRVMFNGSRGRLELEVVESDHVAPGAAGQVKGASLHGA